MPGSTTQGYRAAPRAAGLQNVQNVPPRRGCRLLRPHRGGRTLLVFHPDAGTLPGSPRGDTGAVFPHSPPPRCSPNARPRCQSFLCILVFIRRQGRAVDARGFCKVRAGRVSRKVRACCGRASPLAMGGRRQPSHGIHCWPQAEVDPGLDGHGLA